METTYHALVENIDQGFCVIEMANAAPCDFRFIEHNSQFELQGCLRDAVGKLLRQLMPGQAEDWCTRFQQVLETGEPARFESCMPDTQRWKDMVAFRIGAQGSRRLGVLLRDITAQKEDQAGSARADEEERRLDAVLEVAPVGLSVADTSGALVRMNAELRKIWGDKAPFSRNTGEYAEWKAWWIDEQRQGQRVQAEEWPLARALRGEDPEPAIVEIEAFDAAQSRRTVQVCAAAIRNAEGRINGAVAAVMDISDRLHAEQALRDADRRKDEFLAMLAHELRNPLAPISAAADLLTMQQATPDRIHMAGDIIRRQARMLTGLVDDLLDLSRVKQGKIAMDQVPVDMKLVVSQAVEQARPAIEQRRHQLHVQVAPDSLFVMGDRARLVQVLVNLLANAAKYTRDGGEITLELDALESQTVRVLVRDTGIGMTPDLVLRAFDLFAQADNGSKGSKTGLGLGLALVRHFVQLHGGTVSAESAGIGQGSRFTICLPRLTQAGLHDGDDGIALQGTSRPRVILLVDDNVDAAHMLCIFLESLGHWIHVESTATAALEWLERAPQLPDVCMLNIALPDVDGYHLAQRLRENPRTAKMMLIATTGFGRGEDLEAAFAAGFDYHFIKPIKTERLAELLSFGHLRTSA